MSCQAQLFPEGVFLSHYDLSRPIVWSAQFGNECPLHLEIGFGFGEFLIEQARRTQEKNFIGIELDWARMAKCLSKIESVRQNPEHKDFGRNVRLVRVDVTLALKRLFVERSLDQVTCLFPCPWPKKTHIKHRLFAHDFLCLLNSRLKENAAVKVVTDWYPYLEWILGEVAGTGFEVSVQTIAPQFNTKFERKWKEGGQDAFWELTLKKAEHQNRAVVEDLELRALFVENFDPRRFRFENIVGPTSVIYKDFIFDPRQNLGLVRLVVAEPFLTQHVWVAIIKTREQWCIAKADGHNALPTSGVALALERVCQAAEATTKT